MTADENQDLNGKRIIVVEDDYLLATDICRELRNLGATVLGPAPTPFYATHLVGRKKIDAAVLDIKLHGLLVFDVADMLQKMGVPILFATAYDRKSLPNRFHDTPLLEKPLVRRKLINEISALTRKPQIVAPKIVALSQPSTTFEEAPAQVFARALARGFRPV